MKAVRTLYGLRGRWASWCLPLLLCLVVGCSSTRHLPPGGQLLNRVELQLEVPQGVTPPSERELRNYLRQRPNGRMFGLLPMRLYTYNLSGSANTAGNRFLRRLGEAPVVYSSRLTSLSAQQLRQALINRGFLGAAVEVDTLTQGKKMTVTYRLLTGQPHAVASITPQVADTAVARIIAADSRNSLLTTGMLLDRSKIDAERTRLTEHLRNRGYYAFKRDYISFIADTMADSHDAALTMVVKNPTDSTAHLRYTVRNVYFQPEEASPELHPDTLHCGSFYIIGRNSYLSPTTLSDNDFITPGAPYNAQEFNRTFEGLGRLGIVKSVNIELRPMGSGLMDAIIHIKRNTLMGVDLELEGTNSEGDLGIGAGVTYRHRNVLRSSAQLTAKVRGSYESLSGNFEGLLNNRYTEGAADIALNFPRFFAPLVSDDYQRRMLCSSELSVNGNYQERPEYTRIISGVAWRYKWNNRVGTNRRVWDFVDLSYVFLPHSTINFLDDVAQGNPLLRYSYENHMIMRTGYSFVFTNRKHSAPMPGQPAQRDPRRLYSLRGSFETAGNMLYALSHILAQRKTDGAYKFFGTQYAQYVKGEADLAFKHTITPRVAFAWRAGGGVAVPYGNSEMVPFEKRFYSGGANSVRGWGVRTLGPGRYDSHNSVTDFINQCGDIRIDLNAELRAKLFWVLEGALFVDAGNVWTIRNYRNQPGGEFRLNSFYKELGWAYGAGLRLDFSYFLLRFDLGLKAYNPSFNQERWPLLHPQLRRDATLHFSIGYPF